MTDGIAPMTLLRVQCICDDPVDWMVSRVYRYGDENVVISGFGRSKREAFDDYLAELWEYGIELQ